MLSLIDFNGDGRKIVRTCPRQHQIGGIVESTGSYFSLLFSWYQRNGGPNYIYVNSVFFKTSICRTLIFDANADANFYPVLLTM
jgi:hypothetical protein